MARRVRSGSTSSTASNLSSPADSCCSTSSSDSDSIPTRVQWGPQRTPEKNWLRRVRKKDSREFVRRQSLGWDRSLRDRLESDDDEDDASSTAGSSAGEGSGGPLRSRRPSSDDNGNAGGRSDDDAGPVAVGEPALLGSSVTTRRASRPSPALSGSVLRDSDVDSTDSDDEPAKELPSDDVDVASPLPAQLVKTEPLKEGMPEAAPPAAATPARPTSRRTTWSPALPTSPVQAATATLPSLRVARVKKEPAEPLDTIPFEAPVPATLSSLPTLACRDLLTSLEPVAADESTSTTARALPPSSETGETPGSPGRSPGRPEQLPSNQGVSASAPDALGPDASESEATRPVAGPPLELSSLVQRAEVAEAGQTTVREAEVVEEPTQDSTLPDEVDLPANLVEVERADLLNICGETNLEPKLADKQQSPVALHDSVAQHLSQTIKTKAEDVEVPLATTINDTEIDVVLADVSTVSATEVIVDEAPPPLESASQADPDATANFPLDGIIVASDEQSCPEASDSDETSTTSVADVPHAQQDVPAATESDAQDFALAAPASQPSEALVVDDQAVCDEELIVAETLDLEVVNEDPAASDLLLERPAVASLVDTEPDLEIEATAADVAAQEAPAEAVLSPALYAVVNNDSVSAAADASPSPDPEAAPAAPTLETDSTAPKPSSDAVLSEESDAILEERRMAASPPALATERIPSPPPGVDQPVSPEADEASPAPEAEKAEAPPDQVAPVLALSPVKPTATSETAFEADHEAESVAPVVLASTPLRTASFAPTVLPPATPPVLPSAVETSQPSTSNGRLAPARGDSPRSDSVSSALSTPPINRKAIRLPPAEHAPIVRSIRSRIAKATVAAPSASLSTGTRLARPSPALVVDLPAPLVAEPSRRSPVNHTARTTVTSSSLPSPPARPARAARIPPPSSSRLRADAPPPPPPSAAPAVRRPLRPTVAAQLPAISSAADTSSAPPTAAVKRRAPTPSSVGITPAARAPRSRKPPAAAAVVVDQMSDVKLQSMTLLNTRNNQAYFSPLERVVVRKEGQNRPESPGPKVRKAGSGLLPKATLGKGRALFDAPTGEDEDGWSDEERPPTPKRHVRGPGDVEDYESPMRGPSRSVLKGKAKASLPDQQQQATAAGYSVRWNRGLVLIRPRNSTAPEPQHRSRPRGPKPAIKPVPPLDAFGNVEPSVPLAQVLKRSLVTYTKIIYDDDLPPPPAAAAGKKGRK